MPFVLLSVSLAAVGIRVTPFSHTATPLPVRTRGWRRRSEAGGGEGATIFHDGHHISKSGEEEEGDKIAQEKGQRMFSTSSSSLFGALG